MDQLPPSTSNQNLFNPPILLATWFGAGLLPKAPGTWGSIAALPFAWWIASLGGYLAMLAVVLLVFVVGWWVSEIYLQRVGGEDPGPIVIDEVVGQWIAVSFVTPDLILYGLGFLLFRFADILKPWPIGWADRRIKGGFGIMFDDVLAGIYAAALLYVLQKIDTDGLLWRVF